MRVSLLILAFALVAVAQADEPRTAADLFGSTENLAIAGSADKVEMCMLYSAKLKDGEDARTRHYDSSEYRTASPAIAALLRWKMTSDSSYRWSDDRKACMPIWNTRIRFTKSGQVVTIDLCFGCDILQISRDGRPLAMWDFDPASAELFDAVRIIFPNDRIVRNIEHMNAARVRERALIRNAIEAEKTNQPLDRTAPSVTPPASASEELRREKTQEPRH